MATSTGGRWRPKETWWTGKALPTTCPDQDLLSASFVLLLKEEMVVSCLGIRSQKKRASSDSPVKDATESGHPGDKEVKPGISGRK